ncbi:MAG TPA: hypothetical protein VFE05_07505 [Longimicrobiaceae bacterium]|jgi:hypothetical protein|nr:hypothetical protein [Longimicrobiaceae bacterium]
MHRSTLLFGFCALLGGCAASTSTVAARSSDPGRSEIVGNGGNGTEITLAPDISMASAVSDLPPAQLWAALPAVYTQLGIEPNVNDPGTRTVGNLRFTPHRQYNGQPLSKYVNCGISNTTGAPLADTYLVRMSLRTTVEAQGTGSRLNTTMEATARNVEGTSTSNVRCQSTGLLEQRIATVVGARPIAPR